MTCEELLASVLELYQSRFVNFNVELKRRSRSAQHITCLTSEIRQVLSNLLINAIDATSKQGGALYVRTREATEWRSNSKSVVITVADTGISMSRETQASIYKASYTTKGVSGTGLGLWSSSEIVHRHRGRLLVRSSEAAAHRGTVFQLFLPFQAAAGEVQDDAP